MQNYNLKVRYTHYVWRPRCARGMVVYLTLKLHTAECWHEFHEHYDKNAWTQQTSMISVQHIQYSISRKPWITWAPGGLFQLGRPFPTLSVQTLTSSSHLLSDSSPTHVTFTWLLSRSPQRMWRRTYLPLLSMTVQLGQQSWLTRHKLGNKPTPTACRPLWSLTTNPLQLIWHTWTKSYSMSCAHHRSNVWNNHDFLTLLKEEIMSPKIM